MARKNGVTDDDIVAAYERIGAGVKVARELHVAEVTVYKVLRARGVATDGLTKYRNRIRRFDEAATRALVEKYGAGASATQLAKENGCAIWTVLKALERSGIDVRGKPRMTSAEKQEAKSLYQSGLTFRQVAAKIGRHENTVLRLMNEEFPDVVRSDLIGPGGPHWRGGKTYHHGYAYVWIAQDDPMASMAHKSGYVPEHRLVMARALGRVLLPTETVHHVDGDSTNNTPENLQLRQGRHGKHIVMCCRECGSLNIGPTSIKDC